MVELQDVITSATSYVSEATKASQSVAALITSITTAKTSLDRFKEVFFGARGHHLSEMRVCELLENYKNENKAIDVKNVNGILAPVMDFKGEEEDNYKNVSVRIEEDISELKLRSPENEFLTVNSKEWLIYGCSLQSTTPDRIQLLSLIETEEANSVPVLVSRRFYKRKLDDPNLTFGINASLTGLMVPLDDARIASVLGKDKSNRLKMSGNNKILIPDESIIEDLSIDFSFSPNVYYNKQKCFFLGFLWAVYFNVRTNEIVPIYEYGNIGDRNSFVILSENLIHQIDFFKKRIWNEADIPPEKRQYQLLISYNDDLSDRIKSVFQEPDFFESREELLHESREELIERLFDD